MSYIEMPEPVIDSRKIVLSLWFKVPATSIAAAKVDFSNWVESDGDRPPLTGVVPLVVFGDQRIFKDYLAPYVDIEGYVPTLNRYAWDYGSCSWGDPWFTVPGGTPQGQTFEFDGRTHPVDPSYIGIDCTGDTPKLSVNIVMPDDNKAAINSYFVDESLVCSVSEIGEYNAVGPTIGSCTPPYTNHSEGDGSYCWSLGRGATIMPFNDITYTWTTTKSKADVVMQGRPEFFRTLPAANMRTEIDFIESFSSSFSGGQTVVPDKWHHLLLSLDLTNSCITHGSSEYSEGAEGRNTTSACRMFLAFDDVNLTGGELSCYWPAGHSDQNAILTVNGYNVAGSVDNSRTSGPTDDCWGNNVTRIVVGRTSDYSYAPAPFEFGTVSLPASEACAGRIKRIEMAEFQLFTDDAVDTASERVRRAFITENGSPANVRLSEKLLGKKPEILIHGSKNWIAARNSGTDASPDNPYGTAVGRIEKYKPEPRLGK